MTDPRTPSGYVPALRFDWLTPFYDVIVAATTRERTFKKALIAQAGIASRHEVLDLGCGTGTLAIWIKQACRLANVTALDGDPVILAVAADKARKSGVELRLDQGMSFELPYPDAHFDRVVSSLFFHHLDWESKQRTAREVFRVLKAGGELHVADWGRPTNALMRGLFLSIQLLDGFRNTQDNASGRLIELFRGVGFREVSPQRNLSTVFGTLTLYRAVKPLA